MGKKKDISYNSPQDGAGENKLIQALKERITSLEYQIEELKKKGKTLRESEGKFEDVFETISEGIAYTTLSGKLLYINKSLENIIGIPKVNIIGMNVMKIVRDLSTPETARLIIPVISSYIKGKQVDPFQIKYKNRILEITGNINLKTRRLTGTVRDITGSKQTESELQLSEARLRRAELASRSGNWELHLDTGMMIGSEGARKLYGLDVDTMEYSKVKNIPMPEYRPMMDKALNDLITEGKPYNVEFKIKKADTGEILDIHSIAEFDREKKILFGAIQDITDRKKAEQEIMKNSRDLTMLLEITIDLLETVEKKQVLRKIVEGAIGLTGLDSGAIYMIEGQHLYLEATVPPLPGNFPDEFRKAELSNHPHVQQAVITNKPVLLEDTATAVLTREEQLIVDSRNLGSILYIPLIAQKKVVGVLIVGTVGRKYLFREREIGLNRTLSNIASLTLENSLLFEKLNQNVTELKAVIHEKNIASEALRKSEEKYRNLFENVQDVFYQTDMNGIIREISPSVRVLSDYDAEYLIGRSVREMYYDLKDRDALLKEIVEKGEIRDYELKIRTKSGGFKIVSINGKLVKDISGKPHHIDGSMRDITERIKSEEKLKESEERFRNLFENNLSVMLLIEPADGKIVDVNRSAEKYYGWQREEFLKLKIQDINLLGKKVRQKMDEVVAERERSFEFRHRRADGTVRDVQVFSSKVFINKEVFLHSIIIDITERKLAEKQIKLLNRAIEQSPVSIIITNHEGVIEYANPKFTELTGYSLDEVIGKKPSILKSGKHSPEFYKDLWETILSGKNWFGEFQNKKKNGDLYWESAVISPLLDDQNRIAHFIAVKEDITDKKSLLENLIAAKEKAEDSDRLKTAFLHNISHEIRTPLNAIIGFTGFLEQPDITPELRKNYINIIYQSNNQLLSIIDDILNISHIEAGQLMIRESVTDLSKVMKNLNVQFSSVAESKKIDFRLNFQLADNETVIHTDEGKLIQILTNLLNNAFKFTLKGHVELGCARAKEGIGFYVEDTGIGIPEEEHERIFERFYQVDRSLSRLYGGTGLGLSISDAYVSFLGGKLTLKSSPGTGSVFSFTIPCKQAEKEIDSSESPVPLKKPGGEQRKKILVAEDDDSNFTLIVEMLKPFHFSFLRARNGQEAVDLCKSEKKIDLILMDVKMPVKDGFKASTEIQTFRPGIPIIAQTAYAHSADQAKALKSGCCDYIAKPIDRRQLLALIGKYIR
jgi:PAS domain S-box-containing protein